jgi:hypothetical protein
MLDFASFTTIKGAMIDGKNNIIANARTSGA